MFEKYDRVNLNSLLLDGVAIDKNKTTSNMVVSTYQRLFDIIRNNVRYVEVKKSLN